MSRSSFYLHGGSLALGLILGIFGVIIAFFAIRDRRDRIYSSLLGFGINMALTLIYLKYFYSPS